MATVQPLETGSVNADAGVDSASDTERDLIAARIQAIQNAMDKEPEGLAVLPDEDPRKLADRLEAWTRDLAPSTDAERFLVRQVVGISWKLDRANRFEAAALSQTMIEAIKTSTSEDTEGLTRDVALAAFDASSAGERLRRYQFALIREMRRSLDTFAKLRKQTRAIESEEKSIAGQEEVVIKPVHAGRAHFPLRAEIAAPVIVATKTEASAPMSENREGTKHARTKHEEIQHRIDEMRRTLREQRRVDLDAFVEPNQWPPSERLSASCEQT